MFDYIFGSRANQQQQHSTDQFLGRARFRFRRLTSVLSVTSQVLIASSAAWRSLPAFGFNYLCERSPHSRCNSHRCVTQLVKYPSRCGIARNKSIRDFIVAIVAYKSRYGFNIHPRQRLNMKKIPSHQHPRTDAVDKTQYADNKYELIEFDINPGLHRSN